MNWDGSDVEPRLSSPSLHNPYFANLPLNTLHSYRRLARSTHVANTALPVRQHLNSMISWPSHGGWPKSFTSSRPRGGTGYTYG